MTLNCNGTLVDLSKPKVMGIINTTPDSFYDGGVLHNEKAILEQAEKMLNEGATFLDIGGYSSRPGATNISEAEELERVLPAIEAILIRFPKALLSIDTFRSKIAKESIKYGAVLINDISAGNLDSKMMETAKHYNVQYIMMHMKGTPQTMKSLANYEDVTKEVMYYFSEKLNEAHTIGLNDIVIDPGFGFAKTKNQNFELLNNLELFKSLETPLLIGLSRKSMIYKTLNTTPKEALNGTIALQSIALLKGASILRVHDVKEAIECIALLENFKI